MPTQLSCPLVLWSNEGVGRRGEPVTVGLPWPRSAVPDENCFHLVGPGGDSLTLQTRVLDRWTDGSVRWCLFDFTADPETRNWEREDRRYAIVVRNVPRTAPTIPNVETDGGTGSVRVRTNWGMATIAPVPSELIRFSGSFSGRLVSDLQIGTGTASAQVGPGSATLMETGPIRTRIGFRYGVVDPNVTPASNAANGEKLAIALAVQGWIDLFPSLPTVRITVNVWNPRSAGHPGGNWDLDTSNSVIINRFQWTIHSNDSADGAVRYGEEPGRLRQAEGARIAVWQASSGGEHWNGKNHVDRHGKVSLPFRGYRTSIDGIDSRSGQRATPIVLSERESRLIGMAMPLFWQNFPKRLEGDGRSVAIDLFPGAPSAELQGGERKTHEFYVSVGDDGVSEPLEWCRSPVQCRAEPKWYAESGAIPYLTPQSDDHHGTYLGLVRSAIEGDDTFEHKRELIDEYGWRSFGDLYGDHEAVGRPGPEAMVSHYNNQYDCIAGFLQQYLRSGDRRWWPLATACADHTADIDIYHTDGDKAAYNHGLFWHTYHYAPADTGTHRSYPRSLRQGPVESLTQKMDQLGETAAALKKSYAVGGGPAASHNYNEGLRLAYLMTGNPTYRDAAVGLARFVIEMENPNRTPFRFLSRQYTGLASESGGGGYHGPGRAAGNSIEALITGYLLCGDREFLSKAEQLIRRTVHPAQDLDALNLLNAELRWFYTMTLQAIGRYLDLKIELNQLDAEYAYARSTLLHYARWMAKNERPILEQPEKLQYPTETWAAQDMRKVEVFQFAAKHAEGAERELFFEKADGFFNDVCIRLNEFRTKRLCRPVVLMMRYGWSKNWWRWNRSSAAPQPAVPFDPARLPAWRMFVPQKVIAIRRAKMILASGAIGGLALLCGLVYWVLR